MKIFSYYLPPNTNITPITISTKVSGGKKIAATKHKVDSLIITP